MQTTALQIWKDEVDMNRNVVVWTGVGYICCVLYALKRWGIYEIFVCFENLPVVNRAFSGRDNL